MPTYPSSRMKGKSFYRKKETPDIFVISDGHIGAP